MSEHGPSLKLSLETLKNLFLWQLGDLMVRVV